MEPTHPGGDPRVTSRPLSIAEALGLDRSSLRSAWLALRGDAGVPRTRFGASSLAVMTPRLALTTWLGRRASGRLVPVPNLYNRTPTPAADGWSVRVTQVKDFRGRKLSYDSHNGTDFAVPVGTIVVASAAGRVISRRSEYNRGGLKLIIEHGDGLATSYNHLARTLVAVGDLVARGQPVALSGYSGLDALASFPWVAPHVHYNVILGGALVDPFAAPGEISLWRGGANTPRPADGHDRDFVPTQMGDDDVDRLLAELADPVRRRALGAIPEIWRRGWELTVEAVTYPTRFRRPAAATALFRDVERRERLTLPFRAGDFDGITFADDEGFR